MKKVFISYSWTNDYHEQWVLELAERLRENGVDIILDKWDLKDGQNVYAFMEQIIKSGDLDNVLVICDKGYTEKADSYKGGAGIEIQIITPEIYNDVQQEKFIPILAERLEDGTPCIPKLFARSKYIDMSNERSYEKGFEQLLRNFYEQPEHRKPELGEPPSWLFEEEASHKKTRYANNQMSKAINQNLRMSQSATNFIGALLSHLEEHVITEIPKDKDIDELVFNSIENMKNLRDDYIEFLMNYCKVRDQFDIDIISDMLEEMYQLTKHRSNMTMSYSNQFDNLKFFIHEVFIYTVLVLMRNNMYEEVGYLTSKDYFLKGETETRYTEMKFVEFRQYLRSLEEQYKKRVNSTKLSFVAEMLTHRVDSNLFTKNEFAQCDILLYYLSRVNANDTDFGWFPVTYIYGRKESMKVLQKLKSKRHYEKVKGMFNVVDIEELKDAFKVADGFDRPSYRHSFDAVPSLEFHINYDQIGKSL